VTEPLPAAPATAYSSRGVGPGFDPVLEPVVHAAAVRGERLVAISRAVFCVLVLARFLSLEQSTSAAPYVVNLSALGLAIGYSVWILGRIRRNRAEYWMLVVSVMIDAVGCFVSLLQTVLWPAAGASYRGLLTTPDMSALLVIVYCAGFRVWPRLAVIGALANLFFYLALVTTELSIGGGRIAYGIAEVTMFLFVLGSVMVLSIGTARRTLALVAAGASATVQVDRARRKLAEIVREHHDARSVISAAALSSDMMVRALHSRSGAPPESDLRRQAERLREDLEAARKQLAELGEKAYLELTTLGQVERVETARVLREAVEILKIRFPELTIEAEVPGDKQTSHTDLLVVGGAPSIQRILYNLVNNARDGDGRAGASHVIARVEPLGSQVRLVVEDDGPGFRASSLSRSAPLPASTKPNGMGLGLLMTSELVRVSGGTFNAENRPDGGARLSLILPAAGAAELRR
jgi:signal transduction histidine kinase